MWEKAEHNSEIAKLRVQLDSMLQIRDSQALNILNNHFKG